MTHYFNAGRSLPWHPYNTIENYKLRENSVEVDVARTEEGFYVAYFAGDLAKIWGNLVKEEFQEDEGSRDGLGIDAWTAYVHPVRHEVPEEAAVVSAESREATSSRYFQSVKLPDLIEEEDDEDLSPDERLTKWGETTVDAWNRYLLQNPDGTDSGVDLPPFVFGENLTVSVGPLLEHHVFLDRDLADLLVLMYGQEVVNRAVTDEDRIFIQRYFGFGRYAEGRQALTDTEILP